MIDDGEKLSGNYMLGKVYQGNCEFYLNGDWAQGTLSIRSNRWESLGRPTQLSLSVVVQ